MTKFVKPVLLAIILLNFITVKAQIYEVGVTGGMSAYMGDLNTEKLFNKVYASSGVMLRYNHNQHVSARLNTKYTKLRGGDGRGSQPYIIMPPGRGFEFSTDVFELSIQAEINFLPFTTGDIETRFSPYLFGGLGGIYFNPEAEDKGRPIAPPEDIDRSFSIISIIGYGFKFNLSENFIAGFEWGMRYAGLPFTKRYGTDYLDMVSLKGNPENNDWYSMLGLTFTYKFLDRSRPPCPNHNL